MSTKNHVSLIGRVGASPELKTLEGGKTVCNFSIATNDRIQNKVTLEWEDAPPDWHRIVVWGKRAESAAKNLTKGDLIGVEGHLSVRPYERDGVKMISVQIISDEILYLKKYEAKEKNEAKEYSPELEGYVATDDNLPF